MTSTPVAGDTARLTVPGGDVWRTVLHVPMRDGVVLVADRYADRPDPAPGPVLLERTPYGRRERRGSDGLDRTGAPITPVGQAAHFVGAGLVVVRQDCRGRGDSAGQFVKYLGEAEDGYDTVEWLAAQPWCDGRVATTGVSYSAHVQTALAALAPPHLAAMFVDSGGFASAYEAGVRMGGAFELKQATWAFRHAQDSSAARADPVVRAALDSQDLRAWFGALPWRRGLSPLASVPEYEDYLLDQWAHGRFDEFWRQLGIYGRGWYDAFPDVPSLHLVSWYDPYVRTAVENVQQLSARLTAPIQLVVGPWTHGARSVRHAGDVDFGPAASLDGNLAADYLEFRSDWLRTRLTDQPTADQPVVRYFLMGGGSSRRTGQGRLDHGGSWRTATGWPPPETTVVALYPRPDGTLHGTPAAGEACCEYDFDPRDPVPTIGGQVTSGEPVMVGGAFDQVPGPATYGSRAPYLPLASRPDVLVFQTEPLATDVAIAGPVEVALTVSSSAPDTDFTVKLIDVHPPNEDYPNGFAMNLTDGILRCRYRDSYERPAPMTPGTRYDITVSAPDTANLFAAGHRIRLDVSSSNFPRFDVNPNTDGAEVDARRTVVATNRIYLGEAVHTALTVHVLAGSAAL